ncbi:MAG: carboxypeptidase-like regulatory domain-containing protein [Candidatus Acidiferrales bacterium]
MKRSVLTLVVAMALAFAVAANAQFARGLGTLQGTVVDAHGKKIADASVTIQTSDGLSPHATHTDASGHFEFARFDAGQYDVRAYADGQFSDWDKRVVIRPKKTTDITLRMPPKSDVKVNVRGE